MKSVVDEQRFGGVALVPGVDSAEEAEVERQPANVLVVDDEVAMGEMLSLYLGWKGLSVRTAQSPGEAVNHALQTEFELVILDWDLAGVEALDLLNFFKGTWPKMSVIIFTGKEVDEAFLKKALRGRADGILPKLGSLDSFWAEVRRLLGKRADPVGIDSGINRRFSGIREV